MVLADEPTGNLDQATGQEIMALLGELNRYRGVTLVVITHDAAVAASAGRQIELRDGRVVSDSGRPPGTGRPLGTGRPPGTERQAP